MIELPEAMTITRQMNDELKGKRIESSVYMDSPHKFAFYNRDYTSEEYEAILDGKTIGTVFPYKLPKERPVLPLSSAMERLYEKYDEPQPQNNELYSNFKFTRIEGFDYNGHNGTVSRRDPSKIIRVKDTYYVWYTKRRTESPPNGPETATDRIPSTDWDLAEIWYATSEDGFTWKEQGVAVERPPKPRVGWRSVSTPDILAWNDKFYLYYQGFVEMSGRRGDDCPVAVSTADSPDGPWCATNKVVIDNGPDGSWDQYSIHDPYPLVYKDKIYLYYKSDMNGLPNLVRLQGLAIANDPLGPFKKHPLNPILNSGHETTFFPFREGIAGLASRHGHEHNTIQYALDGVNFELASITSLMPIAAGPYVPDAFTNTKNGRGITWGLCHFTNAGGPKTKHSILARFDCNLSLDVHDRCMKKTDIYLKPEVYFSQGLSRKQRKRIEMDELQ